MIEERVRTVSLFTERKRCVFCRRRIEAPAEGEATTCTNCGRPGPWGPWEAIEADWQAEKDAREAEERAEVQRLQEAKRAKAQAERARRKAKRAAKLQEWHEARQGEIERLRTAGDLEPIPVPGFIAQKEEEAYFAGASELCNWQKEPGGGENWVQVDAGRAIVTDRRIVFIGAASNMEWTFAKLVGFDVLAFSPSVDVDLSMVRLLVTNRQKGHALHLWDFPMFVATVEAALDRHRGRPPREPETRPPLAEFEQRLAECVAAVPVGARADLAEALVKNRSQYVVAMADLWSLGVDPGVVEDLIETSNQPILREVLAEMLGWDGRDGAAR